MKKIVSLSLLSLATLSADPFNGVSFGITNGVLNVNNNIKKTPGNGDSFSNKKIDFLFNVFASYTRSFQNLFAGFDIALGSEFMNGWRKGSSNEDFEDVNNTTFSFAPRLGLKVNDTSAIYGMAGITYNTYGIDASSSLLNDTQMNNDNISYSLALGSEKFITSNISARFEVGYSLSSIKAKGATISSISRNGLFGAVSIAYTF